MELQGLIVERDGSGTIVEWTLHKDGPVDIAMGPSPDPADHLHVLSVGPGTSSVRIDRETGERCFVSIRTASGQVFVAGERRLPLEGLQNFRDLGGYRTADGRHVAWGEIFRSDSLHKLTPADLALLERIGVRTVYDLRGDTERASHPNPLPSVQLAVISRPPSDDPQAVDRAAMAAALDGEQLLRDLYLGMLVHSAPLIGQLLTGLSDDDARPAVFHCHAGKDRTGIVAAVLLLALGVDRDDVLDDYELTRRYRTLEHQQDSLANMLSLGMSAEAAAGVLTAPRWAMSDAIDAIEDEHGGIESYLTELCSVSRAALDALRAAVLTAR